MSSPYRIRVVSDLHVGSSVGLWPPGMVDDDGRKYPQNKWQRYLWRCWVHLWTNAPAPDLVVANGDLIDGPDRRGSYSSGSVTASLDLQQLALVEVLRLATKPGRWYCIRGTAYHEPDRLGLVAELLGARKTRAAELVPQELYYRRYGHTIEFRHHPSGHATLYRGTSLNREIVRVILAAYRRKAPDARLVVTSHEHQYGMLQDCETTAVSTPAWQLRSPYAHRMGKRYLPDIGAVDILLQPDEVPWVEPRLYDLPQLPIDEEDA